MSEEPIQNIYSAGTPLDVSETETTVQRESRASASESPNPDNTRQAPDRDLSDPELTWLGSEEARQHEGHWVALSRETGEFLGMADSDVDFRRWQLRGATVVFVEPPSFRTGI